MHAFAKNRFLLLALAVIVAAVALVAGCGKQDLYEAPGSPYEVVGKLTLPSLNEAIAVVGRTAYIAGGEAGLHAIDWTNPRSPQLLATINTTKFAEDVQVVRTFTDGQMRDIAHVVEGTEGVTSYDVTDPTNPVDYATGTTAVVGRTVYITEDLDPSQPYTVYLAEDWKGVRIFESIPGDPGILAYNGIFVGTNGKAYHLTVRDGWGYCADNETGLCVLDLRVLDLESVALTAWADTPGSARFVALQGNYALVADGVEGLAVFAIDEGAAPVKVAQYDLSGFSESIALRDGLCALAGNTGGVHFMDVSDPTDPVYLGTTATPNATDVLFTEDGYCLVADEDDGFYVLAGRGAFTDIKDPAPVTDLVAEPAGAEAVELTWTITGDDRMRGIAEQVDIRWAEAPIVDEATWTAATPLTGLPLPEAPGTTMTYLAASLSPNTTYHLAMVVIDDAGHTSPLSNNATATTAAGIVLRNATVDIAGGTTEDTYTYSVEAIWTGPLTATEVIIDGVAQTMTSDDGVFYTYQTTLPAGEHTYSFHFTAPGIDPIETPETPGPIVGAAAFTMGSPVGEPGRLDDETLHTVVFSRDLLFGEHEVTQAEWDAVMPAGSNPSTYPGAARPVDNVVWLDAIRFCNALSAAGSLDPAYTIGDGDQVAWDQDADGWRLPTEAEWEYLCRAGSGTSLYNGNLLNLHCLVDPNLDAIGWYCGNATVGPEVGRQKTANDFGLYDMSGNLREWCWDWYGDLSGEAALDPTGPAAGLERVARGGSWYYNGQECRSAARAALPPDSADNTMGFRVVRNDLDG